MTGTDANHPGRPAPEARSPSDGYHDDSCAAIPGWLEAEILDALEEILARRPPARPSPGAGEGAA